MVTAGIVTRGYGASPRLVLRGFGASGSTVYLLQYALYAYPVATSLFRPVFPVVVTQGSGGGRGVTFGTGGGRGVSEGSGGGRGVTPGGTGGKA